MSRRANLPDGLRLAGADEAGWYYLTGLESPRSVWVTDEPEEPSSEEFDAPWDAAAAVEADRVARDEANLVSEVWS